MTQKEKTKKRRNLKWERGICCESYSFGCTLSAWYRQPPLSLFQVPPQTVVEDNKLYTPARGGLHLTTVYKFWWNSEQPSYLMLSIRLCYNMYVSTLLL